MNYWTQLSIEYANQRSYLDDLFQVYPTIPDSIREINQDIWRNVEKSFSTKNNEELIKNLIKLDLFPIKDSYVAFLKRDLTSISRNPKTINRLCGRLYEMGIDKIYEKCSEPKETNRQIGPLFRRWLNNKSLGLQPIGITEFKTSQNDAILNASDNEMMLFAREHLNYKREKGLDFVARFNRKYIIGESKFLTDFGGHQNAQFEDAISLLKQDDVLAEKVAILDGVVYLENSGKMYRQILNNYSHYHIMSALVLRDFLYQL
ncbi:MAG: hypothetical protein MUC29_02455 [Pyrinomonadaceae bacterium]|nr:hypothetical protein [Pyrinomonadaceae bacterium]